MNANGKQRILLAGNPNCGKTSLFNALTGARHKVGNYPGITVEKRSGQLRLSLGAYELVDLPGTYSLTSYSPEERVAQDELLSSEADVVVVVADATNLKRGLVILAQLLLIPRRLVLVLNLFDEAERAGLELDLKQLAQLLGFPVVATVGHKGQGIERLRDALEQVLKAPVPPSRLVLGEKLDEARREMRRALANTSIPAALHDWTAIRLLLDDTTYTEKLRALGPSGKSALAAAGEQRHLIERNSGLDIALYVTDCNFGFIDGLLQEVIAKPSRDDAREWSNRVDRILVHPLLGGPLFLLIMYAVFWATFTVGAYPMDWIESGVHWVGARASSLWATGSTSLLRSVLVDGVIAGVGGVLVFLPNIAILFMGLSFLEDTGYMARAAFIMDRVMHHFGLHGRSFVPMVTGFGCSIPGILATRTIESEKDRLTTMFVLPLMSCGARLPIWMLLVPAFFPARWQAAALWGIYLFGILLALGLARLLRKTVLRGEDAPFVMELPPYRLPTWRSALARAVERSLLYLKKAGTVILAVSVVLWAMTSFPKAAARPTSDEHHLQTTSQEAAADLRASVAGRLGVALEPALQPMGLDWKVGVGLMGALAAKEVFVAQMGIVHALDSAGEDSESLRKALARDYSPAAGLALIVFLLVSAPCLSTIAITRRESGSWKWAVGQFVTLTLLGYVLGVLVFQLGRIFA